MAEYKNNHITPKCLLRQWLTRSDERQGVYTFEAEKQRQYFSADGGRKALSFALEQYFYVPLHNNERIYVVEKWLSDIEGTLNTFIGSLAKGHEGSILRTEQEFHKLLLALFSLNTRTKFDIEIMKSFMQENPDIKKMVEMENDRDIEIAALENMVNSTIELALRYRQCEIVVCKNNTGNLILGDRPFLLEIFDGYSFLPLHPNFFIMISKGAGTPHFTYYDETNDSMIEILNKAVSQNSKHWLIAKDESLLKNYTPLFGKSDKESKPYFHPVQYLQQGYKLT